MAEIEQKLELLYDFLVDNSKLLETELIQLIDSPEKIKDTNKFASLLSELKNPTFIEPLLQKISLASKGDMWLKDYMYAVINLLNESSSEQEFDIPENLIDNLKIWVLNNTGELAWKSANLLKFYETEQAEKIQLKKLEERGDFFLTYAECILGLLHYDSAKHIDLVRQISIDETRDKELKEFAEEAVKNYS
jgi:hypothetical protein